MRVLKHVLWILVAAVILFSACGSDKNQKAAAEAADAIASTGLTTEADVVERVTSLKKEEKNEEALKLLKEADRQFPDSFTVTGEMFRLLRAEKRYRECLDLLLSKEGRFTPAQEKQLRFGKELILLPLVQSELEGGNTEGAFAYFEQLADAGYRGFHNLTQKDLYAPLRQHERFDTVMAKIAENTGIGQQARDFTATLTDGNPFSLSQQAGKVVMVDFWSTNCPPCVEELPNIRKFYEENRSRGFDVISISLDDDKEKLDAFLAENPMPWSTVFSGKGWSDEVARLYNIQWIPSIWLVDRSGRLRYFDVRGDQMKAAIAELLAE